MHGDNHALIYQVGVEGHAFERQGVVFPTFSIITGKSLCSIVLIIEDLHTIILTIIRLVM